MQRKAATPTEYVAMIEGQQRDMLEAIRAVIHKAVPEVEEIIEYGMLGYPGLANLAAQKQYVALYVKPSVLEKHIEKFPGLNCGKSCMRFTRQEQVDTKALASLLKDVYRTRKAEA